MHMMAEYNREKQRRQLITRGLPVKKQEGSQMLIIMHVAVVEALMPPEVESTRGLKLACSTS